MLKKRALTTISFIICVCIIVTMLSGCTVTVETPQSVSVKVQVFVSGGNETITPKEHIVLINRSSTETVFFTLHANEPRNYSQIAISINVSGINDPITCPIHFTNYETNISGAIMRFNETIQIPITISTSDILPDDSQSITVYYSSKQPEMTH